jgi:hypothetical protein
VFVPPIDRLNSLGAGESISMIRANGKRAPTPNCPGHYRRKRISEASTSWKRDAELAEDQKPDISEKRASRLQVAEKRF